MILNGNRPTRRILLYTEYCIRVFAASVFVAIEDRCVLKQNEVRKFHQNKQVLKHSSQIA